MKKILELCLKWRLLVLAFVVLVAAWGFRSAKELPIDAVPDVTNVQVAGRDALGEQRVPGVERTTHGT